MPIALQCLCGKAFRVKDEFAGKKIRCTACKQVVVVPAPQPEPMSEDEDASNFLLEEGPPPAPTPSTNRRREDPDDDDEPPTPPRKRRRADPDDDEDAEEGFSEGPPPKKPEKRKDRDRPRKRDPWKAAGGRYSEPQESRPWIVISPTMISGVLMMVGAVVWFIAGLALGWLFYYPPVLFVIGIITFFRGLAGHED